MTTISFVSLIWLDSNEKILVSLSLIGSQPSILLSFYELGKKYIIPILILRNSVRLKMKLEPMVLSYHRHDGSMLSMLSVFDRVQEDTVVLLLTRISQWSLLHGSLHSSSSISSKNFRDSKSSKKPRLNLSNGR